MGASGRARGVVHDPGSCTGLGPEGEAAGDGAARRAYRRAAAAGLAALAAIGGGVVALGFALFAAGGWTARQVCLEVAGGSEAACPPGVPLLPSASLPGHAIESDALPRRRWHEPQRRVAPSQAPVDAMRCDLAAVPPGRETAADVPVAISFTGYPMPGRATMAAFGALAAVLAAAYYWGLHRLARADARAVLAPPSSAGTGGLGLRRVANTEEHGRLRRRARHGARLAAAALACGMAACPLFAATCGYSMYYNVRVHEVRLPPATDGRLAGDWQQRGADGPTALASASSSSSDASQLIAGGELLIAP